MLAAIAFALIAPGIDLPTGHYTLEEVAERARTLGVDVTVRTSEKDRVFAARLMGTEPLAALQCTVAAAGNLELHKEDRDGAVRYIVQIDSKKQAQFDATAKRVFDELNAIYLRDLAAMHDIAATICAMKMEERQPIARLLQEEYDLYYKQWDEDRTNRELRKKLRELTTPLLAHTIAGERWGAYPVEALWLVRDQMPKGLKEQGDWSVSLAAQPGGFARLQSLQRFAPNGNQVSDVLFESSFGITEDTIHQSTQVYLFTANQVVRTIHLVSPSIDIQDCERPDVTYHLERACAHYSSEKFTATAPNYPPGADEKVSFRDLGEHVQELSRGVMVWADLASQNFVCELTPSAELLNERIVDGFQVSLADLVDRARRWSLTKRDGVFVLECKSKCLEQTNIPLKAARDAGLLMWRHVPRPVLISAEKIVKYARSAIDQGGLWYPRTRRFGAGVYYGVSTFDMDGMALNGALADVLGALDENGQLRAGTYSLSTASRSTIQRIFEYAIKGTTDESAHHPDQFAQFLDEEFVVGKDRNRNWWRIGIQHKPTHGLLASGFTGTICLAPPED